MPIGSTLSGQVGMTIETTPGTRIAPATWKQILSETLSAGRTMIPVRGIGGGSRIHLASIIGLQQPGGQISMDLAAENAPNLLRLAFGTPATAGAGPYTHTYTPSMTAPLPSATIQKGVPDTGATVRPWDFIGSRANSWEITITPGELIKVNYDIVSEYVDTAQTLGTPTWPTISPFSASAHTVMTILGSAECVDSVTLTGANNLTTSNPICSTNPGRQRVQDAGNREYGGTFTKDFESMTFYNTFVAGTVGAMVVTIDAGASNKLVITGRVQFQEDNTPQMGGPGEIVKQTVPFNFVRETTDALAFTAVLTSTTAAAA
jgi:hypothetical protein